MGVKIKLSVIFKTNKIFVENFHYKWQLLNATRRAREKEERRTLSEKLRIYFWARRQFQHRCADSSVHPRLNTPRIIDRSSRNNCCIFSQKSSIERLGAISMYDVTRRHCAQPYVNYCASVSYPKTPCAYAWMISMFELLRMYF